MIDTFACKYTLELWRTGKSKRFPPSIWRVALRKLIILNDADELSDLNAPPGNRLHALTDDRLGQYSIRINDQYRICFLWETGDAIDVEIIDYH